MYNTAARGPTLKRNLNVATEFLYGSIKGPAFLNMEEKSLVQSLANNRVNFFSLLFLQSCKNYCSE